jgi:hypothetical protein
MTEPGRDWFESLLSRARRRFVAGGVLDASAGALAAGAVAAAVFRAGAAGVAAAALCGALAGAGWRWRGGWPGAAELARHLDASVAATQWSAELLATRPGDLPPLARQQRARIVRELGASGGPLLPHRTWSRPLAHLLASAAVAALLLAALGRSPRREGTAAAPATAAARFAPAPVTVRSVRIEVEPPRYTGLPPHAAQGWAVRAEEGARVRFEVGLTGDADRAVLRFGDEEQAMARGGDGAWRTERRARQSELYTFRASAGGREAVRGPLARIDVVRDQPPDLQVLRPGPLTLVSAPAPGSLEVEVAAHDDYAVAGVEARLVLARGLGEQVTFRELRVPLSARPDGHFTTRLDLAALGLAPDVEIFLRCEAWDNREPEPGRTRSATLHVRMPHPEERLSAALAAGIALPSAFAMFRSERQIILDTEQLLRDQPRLAVTELQRRAQGIGFDQRALRLRYGALLGEEVESGLAVEAAEAEVEGARAAREASGGGAGEVGAGKRAEGSSMQRMGAPGARAKEAGAKATGAKETSSQAGGGPGPAGKDPNAPEADEDRHASAGPRSLGAVGGPAPGAAGGGPAGGVPAGAGAGGGTAASLAAQLPAGMVHLHDSPESATYFPDALRREMRAVLAEMWSAEGRLRSVDPRGALPFERRALGMLKDVQQRSRVYVAKIGYETPEIDPARRLTGDLAPVESQQAALSAPHPDPLREAFAWTERACAAVPAAPPLAPGPRAAAEEALRKAALAGDDQALRALAAWRAAAPPGCREAQQLGGALWRLLAPPPPPIARGTGER